MGTTQWQSTKSAGQILLDEYRPYNVRMWTTDHEAAAVCLVVPVTDENREDLGRVYDFPPSAERIYVASIVKHDGTLSGRSQSGPERFVSIKHMSEDMGPMFTGGATRQFMDLLTPLKPKPETEDENRSLTWAHNWRSSAEKAIGVPA